MSYPTITPAGAAPLSSRYPAIAAVSRRTLAKVKSPAMRARHPDVPNLIGSIPSLRVDPLGAQPGATGRL